MTDDFIIFVRPDKLSTLNWVKSTTLQISIISLVTIIQQLIIQSSIAKIFVINLQALHSNLYLSVKLNILLSAPVTLHVPFLTDTLMSISNYVSYSTINIQIARHISFKKNIYSYLFHAHRKLYTF